MTSPTLKLKGIFRLQWEPAQEAHVLLYPEGMVKLNQSAGEILKRCDGTRDIDMLIKDLQQAFNAQGIDPSTIVAISVNDNNVVIGHT